MESAQAPEHVPPLRVQEQQVGPALASEVVIDERGRDQHSRRAVEQGRPDVDLLAESVYADDAQADYRSVVDEVCCVPG